MTGCKHSPTRRTTMSTSILVLLSFCLTTGLLGTGSSAAGEFGHHSQETQQLVQAGNSTTLRCREAETGALVVTLRWICIGCNPDQQQGNPFSAQSGSSSIRANFAQSSSSPTSSSSSSSSSSYASNRPVDLVSFQSDAVTYYQNRGRMTLATSERFSLVFSRVSTGDSGVYGCLLNDRPHIETVTKLVVQDVPAPPGRAYVTGFSSRAMNLSWAPSIDDHNSPISHYVVHAREGEHEDWYAGSAGVREVSTNSTSIEITDLQPFTVYTFRVAAVNALGPSPPSMTSYALATMREVPSGKPTIIKATSASSTSIFVRWAAPPASSLHGEFLGYQLTYEERYGKDDPLGARIPPEVIDIKGPGVTEMTLTDLKPYTQYIISLRVKNPVGMGPPTKVIVMTDEGVPSPPVNVTVLRVTDVDVDLSWLPPAMPNGVIEGYRVYFMTGNYTDVRSLPSAHLNTVNSNGYNSQQPHQRNFPSGTVTSKNYDAVAGADSMSAGINNYHGSKKPDDDEKQLGYRLTNMSPYTKYKIWIQAYTRNNEGSQSAPVVVQTDVGGPGPPHIADLTCRPPHSLVVQWLRPQEVHGAIDFYHVFYRDIDVQRPGEEEELVIATSMDRSSHSLLLPNLTDGGVYEIRIQGRVRSIFDQEMIYEGAYSEMRKALVTANCQAAWSSTSANQDHRGLRPLGFDLNPTALAGGAGGLFAILLIILAAVVYRRNMNAHRSLDGCELGEKSSTGSGGKPKDGNGNGTGGSHAIPIGLFLPHVRSLSTDGGAGFEKEFEAIQYAYSNCDANPLTAHVSQRPENRDKNRYQNILAYDHTLVPLKPKTSMKRGSNASVCSSAPSSPTPSLLSETLKSNDYINANYVDGWGRRDAYIATQGPLPKTTPAFWRMVWEHRVRSIVMITNLVEQGKNKCDQYWPSEGAEVYGSVVVRNTGELRRATYTVRKFLIKKFKSKCTSMPKDSAKSAKAARGEREVVQWHFTAWPDHATPPCPVALLHFVRRSSQNNPSNAGPIVVHCSAGVGRTGAYIVIDAMLAQIKAEQQVGVFDFLRQIRRQRCHLVQTKEQYAFIHEALVAASQAGDTDVPVGQFTSKVKAWVASELLFNQWKLLNTEWLGKPPDVSIALTDFNSGKNRDLDFVPPECSRPFLRIKPDHHGYDYVNASYVSGFRNAKEFIVTQHPMPHTIGAFWRLVMEHKAQTILMFSTTDYQSYPCFWPEVTSESMHIEGLRVTLETERTVVTYPELRLKISWDSPDVSCQAPEDDSPLSMGLILAPGWPNAHAKEPMALVKDIAKLKEARVGPEGEAPWIIMDRVGGVEATTFCCLSAIHEQMQDDKRVDVFLHASLCQQARPKVWRKQDDFLFLYKTLTGLELDLGTWSKKRGSLPGSYPSRPGIAAAVHHQSNLPNNGYPAAIDPNYAGGATTLGPSYRSHHSSTAQQYSSGYHTLPHPGTDLNLHYQGQRQHLHHPQDQYQQHRLSSIEVGRHNSSSDAGYYSSQLDTDGSTSTARNSSVSADGGSGVGYPPGIPTYYDASFYMPAPTAGTVGVPEIPVSASGSPGRHTHGSNGHSSNYRSSSEASVVTVIEAPRPGPSHLQGHQMRIPPEGKESSFRCPEMITASGQGLIINHQPGVRMDLV